MIAFIDQTCIQAYDIALLDSALLTRNSVYDFIIDRYTDRCRITVVIQKIGDTAEAANDLLAQAINLLRSHPRFQRLAQFVMNNGKEPAGFTHEFNLTRTFNRY